MEIDTIVKALRIICKDNEMNDASSDMILDCAVRLHITDKIGAQKDGNAPVDNSATDKQKSTLVKFGIEFSNNITKKEASNLISKKIDSLNN